MSRWRPYTEKLETGRLKVEVSQSQPVPAWVSLTIGDGHEIKFYPEDFVMFVEWLQLLRKHKTRTDKEIEETWL